MPSAKAALIPPLAQPARSLAPREHGAYGQLALPLVTALATARPGAAAALIAGAGVAAFLAHEPLLVVLGQRGPRARREDGPRALRALALLGGAAAALGAIGLALAPPAARIAAIVPLALCAPVAHFLRRGEERTAAGEITSAAALSAAALPVAAASGAPWPIAIGALVAWSLAFAASTWSVRAVIAFQKSRTSLARRILPTLAPLAIAAALAAARLIPPASAAAVLPLGLLALVYAASPPHPRSLKRVGWSLVAGSVITAVVLVAGARG
jgi:hypothetical protein